MDDVKEGTIIIAHLTNGQHVIAKLIGDSEAGPILAEPYELIGGGHPDGKVRFGMQPFLTMGGVLPEFESMAFPGHTIFALRESPDQLSNEYRKRTTGLEVALALPQGWPPKQ